MQGRKLFSSEIILEDGEVRDVISFRWESSKEGVVSHCCTEFLLTYP